MARYWSAPLPGIGTARPVLKLSAIATRAVLMSFVSEGELPHLLNAYGYSAVAWLVALESIGLPVPGETTVIAAALLAGTTHDFAIWPVFFASTAGAIIGDNVGFLAGARFGYRLLLRYGRYIALTEPRIKLGQYLFHCHGGKIAFFGRFIAVIRPLPTFLAGANGMPWRCFLLFDAAGSTAWAAAYGFGVYLLGEAARKVATAAEIGIAIVFVMIIVASAIVFRHHEAELEEKAERALPGPIRRRPWRGRPH